MYQLSTSIVSMYSYPSKKVNEPIKVSYVQKETSQGQMGTPFLTLVSFIVPKVKTCIAFITPFIPPK